MTNTKLILLVVALSLWAFIVVFTIALPTRASASTIYYDWTLENGYSNGYSLIGLGAHWNTNTDFFYTYGWEYNATTTHLIDKVTYYGMLSMHTESQWADTEQVKLHIYETPLTATTSTGNLIAVSDWISLSTTSANIEILLNEPTTLRLSQVYKFVLIPNENALILAYGSQKAGEPWAQGEAIECTDTNFSDFDDCDGEWTYGVHTPDYGSRPVFKLEYTGTISGDDWIYTTAPCITDTQLGIFETACDSEFAEFVNYNAIVNLTNPNYKIEIVVRDEAYNLFDTVSYMYETPDEHWINTTFVLVSSTTDAVYTIQTCILPALAFGEFTDTALCTYQVYGNGTSTGSYLDWWNRTRGAGIVKSPTRTMWEELGCENTSILDFASSTKCALLWAFEPSIVSRERFNRASDAILNSVPIGYARYMIADIRTALTSTSTSVFTRDIEIGKYFGKPNTATTTISMDSVANYTSAISPVTSMIEKLLWLVFSVMFIVWALTRKL